MKLHHLGALAGAILALAFSPVAVGKEEAKSGPRAALCAQDAKTLKGAQHDEYMANCKSERTPQQNRMKTCNVEAGKKELHGDERRAFMSSCLKG